MEREVEIGLDSGASVIGTWAGPEKSRGIVVFAHGSGSGRHSPRNRQVAEILHSRGLESLLLDLLTMDEERVDLVTGQYRFDIDLLGGRVTEVVDWVRAKTPSPIGLFGASTGAAAALIGAASRPEDVSAVVSRGGRPDLAGEALPLVRAPTLLIVGSLDPVVIDLNQAALGRLRCLSRLEIVPGATHLFEERGALEAVGDLAADWFEVHLG